MLDVIKLLRKYNSETNRIEVKSALLGFPKKCYDTISSFSNKYGGIIIFDLNEEDKFKNKKLGIYRWYKNLNIFISNVDKIKSVK